MHTKELPTNIYNCACTKIWFVVCILLDISGNAMPLSDTERAAEIVAERLEYSEVFHIASMPMEFQHPVISKLVAITAATLFLYFTDRPAFHLNAAQY